jgi:hypothetical protein
LDVVIKWSLLQPKRRTGIASHPPQLTQPQT